MPVTDKRQHVRNAYNAYNARDIEAAVALMAPDVEWPDVAKGGFVHGRNEVREHWREQFAAADPRIEPLEFHERPDGQLAVEVRQQVFSTHGSPVSDERLTHVYAFRGGLIGRMDVLDPPDSR